MVIDTLGAKDIFKRSALTYVDGHSVVWSDNGYSVGAVDGTWSLFWRFDLTRAYTCVKSVHDLRKHSRKFFESVVPLQ